MSTTLDDPDGPADGPPSLERRALEAEERARQKSALYELACALCTASSMSELVEVATCYLEPLAPASCTLMTFDGAAPEESTWADVAATWPRGGGLLSGARFPLDGSPFRAILIPRELLIVEDSAAADWLDPQCRRELAAKGRESLFSAPLLFHGRVVGRIIVTWRAPRRFTPHEIEIIRAIASQGTAVAERIWLLDASKQNLEDLTRLREALERKVTELSAPIIPVADDIVVMPLVGSVDRARAEQVMAALLEGVQARRATTAILDITGIPAVDEEIAGALLRVAKVVGLLGARAVVTGVRPEIARTLIDLGADLDGVITRRTVQEGIQFAMRTRARRAR